MSLASNWPRLSKATREAFASLFQRPSRQRSVISPGGRFKIHYDVSGSNSVSLVDENSNGLPDYVDEVSRTFDAAWDLEISELGYDPPLSDGDEFFDVYIENLAPQFVYGFTWPESFGGSVTSSYIEIDNDYGESIYASRGLDGLHVTAAHEFFHAIQFAYFADLSSAGWWHESTATWIEDVAYTDVNDYYQYIPFFFDSPTAPLDRNNQFSNFPVFGTAIYAHHLDRVYGKASIRRTWEVLQSRDRSPYPESLGDLDAGMPLGGFKDVLPRFAVWNYFTQSRSRSGYYPEASFYPSVKTNTVLPAIGLPVSGTSEVDHLAMDYIQVPITGHSGGLRAAFRLDADATWKLLVLLISDTGHEILRPRVATQIEIPQIDRFSEIVFIPIVTSRQGSRFDAEYTISLDPGIAIASDFVGDLDQNGQVWFPDFLVFATSFKKDAADQGYDQTTDLDGNGKTDFLDFLIFVQHFGEPS